MKEIDIQEKVEVKVVECDADKEGAPETKEKVEEVKPVTAANEELAKKDEEAAKDGAPSVIKDIPLSKMQ